MCDVNNQLSLKFVFVFSLFYGLSFDSQALISHAYPPAESLREAALKIMAVKYQTNEVIKDDYIVSGPRNGPPPGKGNFIELLTKLKSSGEYPQKNCQDMLSLHYKAINQNRVSPLNYMNGGKYAYDKAKNELDFFNPADCAQFISRIFPVAGLNVRPNGSLSYGLSTATVVESFANVKNSGCFVAPLITANLLVMFMDLLISKILKFNTVGRER